MVKQLTYLDTSTGLIEKLLRPPLYIVEHLLFDILPEDYPKEIWRWGEVVGDGQQNLSKFEVCTILQFLFVEASLSVLLYLA